MNRALLFFLTGFFLISCGEDKTEKTTTPVEPQVKSAVQIDPKARKIEDLKKMEVSGLDVLQNLLPESIADIKRTKFSMTSNLGYSTVLADYDKNSKTYVHMVLYDCAGQTGADLYKSTYQDKLELNEASEAGYTKAVDLDGEKAIEKYEAETKVTTLTFMANEKVLVVMTGKNVPMEKLKEAASKM